MAISRLSKNTEAMLSSALETVVDLVEAGSRPADALLKIATERSLSKNYVELLARAYNNGRSLYHLKKSATLVDKAAGFPLVDTAEVLRRMFPDKAESAGEAFHKNAVSCEYTFSPNIWLQRVQEDERLVRTKSADLHEMYGTPPSSVLPALGEAAEREAFAKKQVLQRQLTNKHHAAIHASYKVAECLEHLAEYFRKPDGLALQGVQKSAGCVKGLRAERLLDYVGRMFPPAMKKKATFHEVRWDLEPYTLVTAALNAIDDYRSKWKDYNDFTKTASAKMEDVLRPFVRTAGNPVITGSIWAHRLPNEKTGTKLPITPIAIGTTLASATKGLTSGLAPLSPAELIDKEVESIAASPHEANLRAIRVNTMLHGLMATDPIIGSYSPEEVFDAYNQLSDIAPHAAEHQLFAQTALRQFLEQGASLGAFDVDQMLEAEKKIRQRNAPETKPRNTVSDSLMKGR